MQKSTFFSGFSALLRRRPQAVAVLRPNEKYPGLYGVVRFYQTRSGVLVAAEFSGLPTPNGVCGSPIFGFHIHETGLCSGNTTDPFADVGTHYNPENCPHPYHAGDLPPIFGAKGRAFSVFLTDRFTVRDIVGRGIILHGSADDFTTQPAGNSGEKIACAQIQSIH